MKIAIIAIGTKMPKWVQEANADFLKRFPSDFSVKIIEVPAAVRSKQGTPELYKRKEAKAIRAALPKNALLVCLDVLGKSVSTEQLAAKLDDLKLGGRPIAMIIGGPDGIAADLLAEADLKVSLSALTLPHPLVRVLLVEQLYRVWSILAGHPYHRA